MLEIEKTPMETYKEFRSNIIELEQDMLLSGFALFCEPNHVSLRPQSDEIVVGVATELPDNLKVSNLVQALEEGKPAVLAIIEALVKMVSTSSRPDQRSLMKQAMDRLDDFSQFLIHKPAEKAV